ncbi:type II toxin-antitoxin system RelE/ParE family toxin [candidate division KSB1 bacterium]|nr:type II toxin-antitoxin system RelE/ParE family toxin [candidate division KSB1 bacterium]
MNGKFITRAYYRLREIKHFISKHSPEWATKFQNFLISKVKPLSSHPQMERIVPEKQDPSIRELIVNHYRIIYKIDAADIGNA